MSGSDTIFSKIVNKEVPADIVYESDSVLAFRDINPQAPIHILVIPKKHIRGISSVSVDDESLLGELLFAAHKVAKQEGIANSGFRIVINDGDNGGQEVGHLHLHVLGGRKLSWPPG